MRSGVGQGGMAADDRSEFEEDVNKGVYGWKEIRLFNWRRSILSARGYPPHLRAPAHSFTQLLPLSVPPLAQLPAAMFPLFLSVSGNFPSSAVLFNPLLSLLISLLKQCFTTVGTPVDGGGSRHSHIEYSRG